RPVHVQPSAVLPTDRTERQHTLDRCQRDYALHSRLQLDHLLIDRDHSCEREVCSYTEFGHRVLRVEREWELRQPPFCSPQGPVSTLSTTLQLNPPRTQKKERGRASRGADALVQVALQVLDGAA